MNRLEQPLIFGEQAHPPAIYQTQRGTVLGAACDVGFGYKDGGNEDRILVTP